MRPFLHRAHLGADRDHRLAEAVELGLRLALRGLDHERPRHRERHGRRVEAEIDEALGDVLDADPGGVLQTAQVEDAFVRDQAARPGVEHGIVRREAAWRCSSR
jgi:hypothetical protein